MHELHVLVYCADSRYTEGDYARIDGGKACDGVKAVESTRRAEDGMGNWHGQERMVVGSYGNGRWDWTGGSARSKAVRLLVCWQRQGHIHAANPLGDCTYMQAGKENMCAWLLASCRYLK
jgi:hypothetical protein